MIPFDFFFIMLPELELPGLGVSNLLIRRSYFWIPRSLRISQEIGRVEDSAALESRLHPACAVGAATPKRGEAGRGPTAGPVPPTRCWGRSSRGPPKGASPQSPGRVPLGTRTQDG